MRDNFFCQSKSKNYYLYLLSNVFTRGVYGAEFFLSLSLLSLYFPGLIVFWKEIDWRRGFWFIKLLYFLGLCNSINSRIYLTIFLTISIIFWNIPIISTLNDYVFIIWVQWEVIWCYFNTHRISVRSPLRFAEASLWMHLFRYKMVTYTNRFINLTLKLYKIK